MKHRTETAKTGIRTQTWISEVQCFIQLRYGNDPGNLRSFLRSLLVRYGILLQVMNYVRIRAFSYPKTFALELAENVRNLNQRRIKVSEREKQKQNNKYTRIQTHPSSLSQTLLLLILNRVLWQPQPLSTFISQKVWQQVYHQCDGGDDGILWILRPQLVAQKGTFPEDVYNNNNNNNNNNVYLMYI